MKIIPSGHRILVKPDNIEEVDPVLASAKKSGIILSDMASRLEQTSVDTGVVLDVGPNAWKAFDDGHPWASVGDKVVYAKYGGKLVVDPDTKEKFLILNDDDIIGVIK